MMVQFIFMTIAFVIMLIVAILQNRTIKKMREKCLENFIDGAVNVVKDTDLAMKALGIDEETQEKIRKAREIVHKAHCAALPVPDKIVIRKGTEPEPPSFEEAQGEKKMED